MAVNIDESGNDGCTAQINGVFGDEIRKNLAELTVYNLKSALMKRKIAAKDSGIFIEQRYKSP